MTLPEAASSALRAGIRVVPLRRKVPWNGRLSAPLRDWQTRVATPADFVHPDIDGIGWVLGNASRRIVDVDLDGVAPELAELLLTPTRTFGRAGQRRHAIYFATGEGPLPSHRHVNPDTRACLIELRGDGAQTMAPPSRHPDGSVVATVDRLPVASIDYDELDARVREIADRSYHGSREDWRARIRGAVVPDPVVPVSVPEPDREDRARRYLAAMDPAISGSGGQGQLWRAATALVCGFCLPAAVAVRMLAESWNATCVPPWTERELARACRRAETSSTLARGWLL